jgi:hypothetical protein
MALKWRRRRGSLKTLELKSIYFAGCLLTGTFSVVLAEDIAASGGLFALPDRRGVPLC